MIGIILQKTVTIGNASAFRKIALIVAPAATAVILKVPLLDHQDLLTYVVLTIVALRAAVIIVGTNTLPILTYVPVVPSKVELLLLRY